jgi:hypothetical protein
MRFAKRSVLGGSLLFLSVIPLAAQTPPHAQVGSPPATAQAAPEKSRPTTYGTSQVSYIEVPAAEFLPGNSSLTYASDMSGMGQRWGTNNGSLGVGFVAGIHLPAGAQPVYLELDFLDTNATQTVYGSFVECSYLSTSCSPHPAAGGGPGDCIVGGYICSGSAFNGGTGAQAADLTPDGITVDNFTKSYRLYAATFADDATLKIGGMIVGYVLQVSPAPVIATFDDVPTSDFAFQFIEAFNAAGITVGCNTSPPQFCPDRNVTRREMAVFFAKALGLQFQ